MEAKNENVSMRPSANRVADALVEWMKKEAEDREILGDDIDMKHYAKDKLKYFETIRKKYADTKNPDERRYLNTLKDKMPKLRKAAMPRKIERIFYDLGKVAYKAIKVFVDGAKQIGEGIAVYQERKRDEAVKKLLAKDKNRLETIARYEKAVRPVLNKDNQQIVGPDSHLRGNNIETERGKDEKVRNDFDNDLPLLPKKNAKAQSVPGTDEALLQKNREGTGKGLTI